MRWEMCNHLLSNPEVNLCIVEMIKTSDANSRCQTAVCENDNLTEPHLQRSPNEALLWRISEEMKPKVMTSQFIFTWILFS